jgi:hypothetical protein
MYIICFKSVLLWIYHLLYKQCFLFYTSGHMIVSLRKRKNSGLWNSTSMNTKSIVALKGRTISESGINCNCLSQWPRGLMRGSAAASLRELRVRIPPNVWMCLVCVCVCVCCVFSGRSNCVGMITLPEDCYGPWCVLVLSWSPGPLGALRPWKN